MRVSSEVTGWGNIDEAIESVDGGSQVSTVLARARNASMVARAPSGRTCSLEELQLNGCEAKRIMYSLIKPWDLYA